MTCEMWSQQLMSRNSHWSKIFRHGVKDCKVTWPGSSLTLFNLEAPSPLDFRLLGGIEIGSAQRTRCTLCLSMQRCQPNISKKKAYSFTADKLSNKLWLLGNTADQFCHCLSHGPCMWNWSKLSPAGKAVNLGRGHASPVRPGMSRPGPDRTISWDLQLQSYRPKTAPENKTNIFQLNFK